jgi:hypothetical protein
MSSFPSLMIFLAVIALASFTAVEAAGYKSVTTSATCTADQPCRSTTITCIENQPCVTSNATSPNQGLNIIENDDDVD